MQYFRAEKLVSLSTRLVHKGLHLTLPAGVSNTSDKPDILSQTLVSNICKENHLMKSL